MIIRQRIRTPANCPVKGMLNAVDIDTGLGMLGGLAPSAQTQADVMQLVVLETTEAPAIGRHCKAIGRMAKGACYCTLLCWYSVWQ